MMDIGNLIILLSIVQAVLLLILLLSKQKVRFPTHYLVLLLLGLLYFQLEFLLVRNAAPLSTAFLLTPYGGWLMMGPLIYFFTQSLYEKKTIRQLLMHLLPFFVIAFIIPLFLNDPLPKRGFDYGMLSVFTHRHLGLSGFNFFYGSIFFLQFIHFGGYLLRSFYYNRAQANTGYSGFVKRLLLLGTVAYAACLLFYTLLLGSPIYGREWDYFLILPTAVFIYFICYVFLAKPELWRADIRLKKAHKYERSAMSFTELEAIVYQMDTYIHDQKAYIDPELSLTSLAQLLGITRHKLSQAINSVKGIGFNDYINQYRVAEAQKLIQQDQTGKSILSIAYEAGFNNKATFNKYFKKITGQTPSAYKKLKNR